LEGYDYSQAGAYFITVCTRNRECVLGDIADGEMRLNDAGRVVVEEWMKSADIRKEIELDAFVIMPNHIHGIIVIDGRGTARRAPTCERFGQPTAGSIPTIVRAFKSACTIRINDMRNSRGTPFWQRNYYEHVIRDEDDLNRIRQYIMDNPARWAEDENNPASISAQADA
jgi:REP element-mobilizing transposase RayT